MNIFRADYLYGSDISGKKTGNHKITSINVGTNKKYREFRAQYPIEWFEKRFGSYSLCQNSYYHIENNNFETDHKKIPCVNKEPFKDFAEYESKCLLKGAKFTEKEIKSMLVAARYFYGQETPDKIRLRKDNKTDQRILGYIDVLQQDWEKNPQKPLYQNLTKFLNSGEYFNFLFNSHPSDKKRIL